MLRLGRTWQRCCSPCAVEHSRSRLRLSTRTRATCAPLAAGEWLAASSSNLGLCSKARDQVPHVSPRVKCARTRSAQGLSRIMRLNGRGRDSPWPTCVSVCTYSDGGRVPALRPACVPAWLYAVCGTGRVSAPSWKTRTRKSQLSRLSVLNIVRTSNG